MRRRQLQGDYIAAAETVAAAEKAGLSVGDYVDQLWGNPGGTQRLLDKLERDGAFDPAPRRVCEIGAGTGRYMEKIIQRCPLESYESYETAADWAEWLESTYGVTRRTPDGETLSQTPDGSVDLVNAHGVFVYTPFLVACSYFREIVRVLAPGGRAVFDVFTEDCFDEDTVTRWLDSEHRYPALLPNGYVTDFFADHGFTRRDGFTHPYGSGVSRYYVFVR